MPRKKRGAVKEVPVEADSRRLMQVREGLTLFWPRKQTSGLPLKRGGAGYVVWSDDPLLNTNSIPEAVRQTHAIQEDSDQRHKLVKANPGCIPSPHQNAGADRLYVALEYEGYHYGYAIDDREAVDRAGQASPDRPPVVPNSQ
jgi:hypothetical protein